MKNGKEELFLKEAITSDLSKGSTLNGLCERYQVDYIKVLAIIDDLIKSGFNIDQVETADKDVFYKNYGHRRLIDPLPVQIKNNNENIRFVLISDTHMGSRYEQLGILNNIYYNAYLDFKPDFFIHCGDISAGVYAASKKLNNQTLFARTFQEQVDHIVNFYPYIENTPTYFITGERDETHLKADNEHEIGIAVSNERSEDLIYLGQYSKKFHLYNDYNNQEIKLKIEHKSGRIPYTVSYPTQREIDAMRSDDKPDYLIQAHWFTSSDFRIRGIRAIQVPGLVGDMANRNDMGSNTIGAWYIDIKRDNKLRIISQTETRVPYYRQEPIDNYQKVKALKLGGRNGKR